MDQHGRAFVIPYKQKSKSAKALADAIGAKRLKLSVSNYKPRSTDFVINWGNSTPSSEVNPNLLAFGDSIPCGHYLNYPAIIGLNANKLMFFENMVQAGFENIIPPFWKKKEDIPDDSFPIVCRTTVVGHSGAGIVIADSRDDLVDALLYVKYVKKEEEYRLHVGYKDDVPYIFCKQRKARRLDHDSPNWQVRSHANGFIFARDGFEVSDCCTLAALLSFEASGLDFGAFDVIYNKSQDKAYVLEVNTAPGLEGQTIQDYADYFTSVLK